MGFIRKLINIFSDRPNAKEISDLQKRIQEQNSKPIQYRIVHIDPMEMLMGEKDKAVGFILTENRKAALAHELYMEMLKEYVLSESNGHYTTVDAEDVDPERMEQMDIIVNMVNNYIKEDYPNGIPKDAIYRPDSDGSFRTINGDKIF